MTFLMSGEELLLTQWLPFSDVPLPIMKGCVLVRNWLMALRCLFFCPILKTSMPVS